MLLCLLAMTFAKRNQTLDTCQDTYAPGNHEIQVSVGSTSRTFTLYVPYGAHSGLRPAVFLFHGYSSNPNTIDSKASMTANAESAKWYAVLPLGSGLIRGWNGAGCCPGVFSDDVAFARAIVDWLKANTCVDQNKVYSTGFSNGGFMTHRLACEASDIFSGFAPHSGLLGSSSASSCTPSRSVPVVSFHGTADGVVSYFGNGNTLGFWDTMAHWTANNACGGEENAVDVLVTETTHCVRYNECSGGVPVEFCEVSGLAHDWSGNDDSRPQDVDATAYIFMFFQEVSVWTDRRLAAGLITDLNFQK